MIAHLDLVEEFLDRMSLGDRRGAVLRARELVDDGVPVPAMLDVVSAAQREVGRLWQVNAWTVSQEHIATAVSEAVVAALLDPGPIPEPRGRIGVLCADEEWHVLPAKLVAEHLESVGFDVHFVGGSVPAPLLYDTLPGIGLDAVAVSCTLSLHLLGAARTVAAAHAAGLPAVVGGAAFGAQGDRAERIGADAWAADPDALVDRLASWQQERPALRRSPALHADEAETLQRHRDAIVTDAYAELASRLPAMADYSTWQIDRTREDLHYHVRYLAVALAIDDPTVYLEMVPWLVDVLAARGVPSSVVTTTLDVLDHALTLHGATRAVDLVNAAATQLAG